MESDEAISVPVRDKVDETPPQVRDILHKFTARLKHLDPDLVEGIYLTGSLALQDFHPRKSDIDLVLLCKALPDKQLQRKISVVHKTIETEFPASTLNCWYITYASLDYNPISNPPALLFEKGKLRHQPQGISPVTLYELSKYSLFVSGIPVDELSIRVSPKEINDFLYLNINSYWSGWLDKHNKWSHGKLILLLFPRMTEWVILGLTRQFYTLKTGLIASKSQAGHYAIQHLPREHHDIIAKAIQIRKEKKRHVLTIKSSYSVRPSPERCNQTLRCARFIIHEFNKQYKTSNQ
jgi:hypothetical protein